MPNPQGYNGVDPVQPAYGARKRMGEMQKSAPLAGGAGSVAAQETPRRARQRALRPSPGAVEAAPAPAPQASPAAAVQAFWQQAAPFLDPDLQWLAGG